MSFADRHHEGMNSFGEAGFVHISIGEEYGFSHKECDLCKALPGNRHYLVGCHKDTPTAVDTLGLICDDCVVYMANGDLPEEEVQ